MRAVCTRYDTVMTTQQQLRVVFFGGRFQVDDLIVIYPTLLREICYMRSDVESCRQLSTYIHISPYPQSPELDLTLFRVSATVQTGLITSLVMMFFFGEVGNSHAKSWLHWDRKVALVEFFVCVAICNLH